MYIFVLIMLYSLCYGIGFYFQPPFHMTHHLGTFWKVTHNNYLNMVTLEKASLIICIDYLHNPYFLDTFLGKVLSTLSSLPSSASARLFMVVMIDNVTSSVTYTAAITILTFILSYW